MLELSPMVLSTPSLYYSTEKATINANKMALDKTASKKNIRKH